MKSHLTGTPAISRRNRKFGTVIQPFHLALNSPAEPSTDYRGVQSSTPLRGKLPRPHTVEATPIRAPENKEVTPLSPGPQMITGGLAKLCVIM